MHILDAARRRFATKSYDATRKLSAALVADLLETLRLSPSSVNSQPWHYFVAESAASRARIASTMRPGFAYNADKVDNASHVVVFCARRHLSESHLERVIGHEAQAGRFADPDARQKRAAIMKGYVHMHQQERQDESHWAAHQVYLALGFFLAAAASAGIDATPIEGFDPTAMDRVLNLSEAGLQPLVVVTLGHHADDDFNATLPKSRLPQADIMTFL